MTMVKHYYAYKVNVCPKVVIDCFEVIYAGDKGSTIASVSTPPGPSRVAKAYGGGLPQTGAAGWMLNRRPPELHAEVLLPAYRAAVKLALDQVHC